MNAIGLIMIGMGISGIAVYDSKLIRWIHAVMACVGIVIYVNYH